MKFEELNDYCLIEIFDYLCIKDQVTITDVLDRFSDIVTDYIWKPSYRSFDMKNPLLRELSSAEYERFFRLNVPHMQMLIMSCKKFGSFVVSFSFPELRVLNVAEKSLMDGHLGCLVNRCAKLEVLLLPRSVCTHSAFPAFLNQINPKIKELRMDDKFDPEENEVFLCQMWKRLQNLQTVHMTEQFSSLSDFLQHPTLKDLHIYCSEIYIYLYCLLHRYPDREDTFHLVGFRALLANLEEQQGRKRVHFHIIYPTLTSLGTKQQLLDRLESEAGQLQTSELGTFDIIPECPLSTDGVLEFRFNRTT